MSKEDGFTIVETIIVLAIAGLILLIVLLAIPALGRSSRNNQRRQDIQTVLQAVSHYELNNSGNMPGAATPIQLPRLSYYTNPTVGYYDLSHASCNVPSSGVSSVTFCTSSDWTNAPATAVDNLSNSIENVIVYNHEKCDPANPGSSTRTGAGYSDAVALYAIETGNGVSAQCEQL